MKKKKSFAVKFLIVVLLLGLGFLIFWFYVPFSSSSVRAGQLNYVMYKGVVFKTYEGKLIQTGLRSNVVGVQSNEFEFSIVNKNLAEKLMQLAGQEVKLHYKEYYGALPWRGYTRYIVDSIVSVEETRPATPVPGTVEY